MRAERQGERLDNGVNPRQINAKSIKYVRRLSLRPQRALLLLTLAEEECVTLHLRPSSACFSCSAFLSSHCLFSIAQPLSLFYTCLVENHEKSCPWKLLVLRFEFYILSS